MEEFLTIQDLHVSYHTADETVYAVNGLNLSVKTPSPPFAQGRTRP